MKSVDACRDGRWSILTWKRADGSSPTVRPFRCKSWRHDGDCRMECGACDFARISSAISARSNWVLMVLTYPVRDWPDSAALFSWGVVHWARLRKRIARKFGKMEYIQTWEVTKRGYPHANVIVSNENLYNSTILNSHDVRKGFLVDAAVECGFGKICYLEAMKDAVRMGGYLTKLANELTGAAVKSQVPVNAPPHFRRIRASRGTLPKRIKDDTITGQLYRLPADTLSAALDLSAAEKEAGNRSK